MSEFAVVGSGPNGLSAAARLASAGRSVIVLEQAPTAGGGTRTEELTLPGFMHDVCAAVHPAGVASPAFAALDLDVDWIQPEIPLTHPLGGGDVVALFRGIGMTANQFGAESGRYLRLMSSLARSRDQIIPMMLGPMRANPDHKVAFSRIALPGALPATLLAKRLGNDRAKALLVGLSAHAIAPLNSPGTAGVGLFLGLLGHTHGWPIVRGGSSAIASALIEVIERNGGFVHTGVMVEDLRDIDAERFVLDLMPPAVLDMTGDRLSQERRRALARWAPGPGVFKVDWALDRPIPWSDPLSPRSATVHVGGSAADIVAAEDAVMRGDHPERPFVLVSQPSVFDPLRAPEGMHTGWGYCHVPNGSDVNMTEAIEAQIERFAPGFRDTVIARSTISPRQYQAYNPNYLGGDIGGGRFGLRKVLQLGDTRPFSLGGDIYLGSSAAPPGGGVHGMCGYLAAGAALGS